MAYDFPTSPTVGQIANGYVWNGQAWAGNGNLAAVAPPSEGPPANPVNGQLWWETDSGNLFVWYNDGNSSQWVQISGPGLGDAPSDGKGYVRQNGVWAAGWTPIGRCRVTGVLYNWDLVIPASVSALRVQGVYNSATTSTATSLSFRASYDGGATFAGGTSDYQQCYFSQEGNNYGGVANYAASLLALTNATSTASVSQQTFNATISLGATGKHLRYVSLTQGYNVGTSVGSMHGFGQGGARVTNLRFLTADGAVIGVGTDFLVEGLM